MLKLEIPAVEMYDEVNNEFIYTKGQVLTLEHSLVSLAKWESKWCRPFLTKTDKSTEESVDYIRCMTLTQNVSPSVYAGITPAMIDTVSKYIAAPMTATTFSDRDGRGKNRDVITAEIIYYWMISLNIPFECQKWHLNRLLTLINVCSLKNAKPKKMSKSAAAAQQHALNAARRKQMNTTG